MSFADLISSLDSGVSVDGGDRSAEGNEVGVLKTSAVADGTFRPNENKVVTGRERERVRLNPKANRIIVSRANTPALVGASAYIERSYSNLFLSDKLWQLEPIDESALSMRWLGFVLGSPDFRKRLREAASGTSQSMVNISKEDFLRLVLYVPPLREQEAMVQVLETWRQAILGTTHLIETKELHYEGIARRFFSGGSKRPSCSYPRISEIADRIVRQNNGGDYPLLTISSSFGFVRQEEKFSRYMAGESAKTYTLLRAGEFSYNKGNSKRYKFGCVFQLQDYDAALVPSVYVSFRLHDGVCASYMRHLFAVDYLKPQLRALVKTGVRNNGLLNVRPDEFMGVRVPLPSYKDQVRISNALDAIRFEINLLEKQLTALRKQSHGLMQKLLTGQWKLPKASNGSGKEGD